VDEEKDKVRFITPDWVKSPPPHMEGGELGVQLILGLHSLMKAAQVHGTDSLALDQSIPQYLHLINPRILSAGGITLEIAEEGFLLNNQKIRGKPGDHAVFKSFMRNLIGWRIGKLEIHNPLDEVELKEFISTLLTLKGGDENNSLYLMKQLSARKIESLSVGKLRLKEPSLPKAAAGKHHPGELYFAAIGIVSQIMEEVAGGRALNMRKAKRLMQQMISSLIHDESILVGLATIKNCGEYLYNHSVNVAIYSMALGLQLELPKTSLVQLGISALFHDIGTIRIPQSILHKSDELTGEEWGIMQKHPIYSVETIVQENGWSDTTARIIETAFEHHIKVNRTGYPKLTSQRELTLLGKIIAIGDFYDNIVRSHSYQLFPIFSDRAIGLLLDRSGKDFDPTLVKLFVRLVGFYPIGTLVMLENGEMGIVATPNKDEEMTDRPKVLRIHFQDGEYKGTGVLDLAEKEEKTGKYRNTIDRCVDPNEYQLNVAELLFYV
jgi:HD-GYP domain-containing protein (c-di-GMP phosphodiesterase class II)